MPSGVSHGAVNPSCWPGSHGLLSATAVVSCQANLNGRVPPGPAHRDKSTPSKLQSNVVASMQLHSPDPVWLLLPCEFKRFSALGPRHELEIRAKSSLRNAKNDRESTGTVHGLASKAAVSAVSACLSQNALLSAFTAEQTLGGTNLGRNLPPCNRPAVPEQGARVPPVWCSVTASNGRRTC